MGKLPRYSSRPDQHHWHWKTTWMAASTLENGEQNGPWRQPMLQCGTGDGLWFLACHKVVKVVSVWWPETRCHQPNMAAVLRLGKIQNSGRWLGRETYGKLWLIGWVWSCHMAQFEGLTIRRPSGVYLKYIQYVYGQKGEIDTNNIYFRM